MSKRLSKINKKSKKLSKMKKKKVVKIIKMAQTTAPLRLDHVQMKFFRRVKLKGGPQEIGEHQFGWLIKKQEQIYLRKKRVW